MALLVIHCLLVCVYLTLNADQNKFFSTSCLWSDFGAMLSSSLTVTGSLLVYSWTSTCLIILAWLIVARLDIRKFPGLKFKGIQLLNSCSMRVVSGHFSKTLNVGMSAVILFLPIILSCSCVVYSDQYVVLMSPRPVW